MVAVVWGRQGQKMVVATSARRCSIAQSEESYAARRVIGNQCSNCVAFEPSSKMLQTPYNSHETDAILW